MGKVHLSEIISGAYISFKEELIKYVKSNVSADSQVLKVKNIR
jgi:hypothetical protein